MLFFLQTVVIPSEKYYAVYCSNCGKVAGVVRESEILSFTTTSCVHCGERVAKLKMTWEDGTSV